MSKKELSDNEWKKKLSKEEYHLLREKGTEKAFSGEYWDCTDEGTYVCAGCGEPLLRGRGREARS